MLVFRRDLQALHDAINAQGNRQQINNERQNTYLQEILHVIQSVRDKITLLANESTVPDNDNVLFEKLRSLQVEIDDQVGKVTENLPNYTGRLSGLSAVKSRR